MPSSTGKSADKKPREARDPISPWAALRNAISQLDYGDAGRSTANFEDLNLDILSRAVAALGLRTARNLPEPREALVARFALEETLVADKLGQFSVGDDCSNLIVENGDYSQRNRNLDAVKHLSAYGRTREAKLVEASIAERDKTNNIQRPRRKPNNENEVIESIKLTSTKTRECLSAITAGNRIVAFTDAQTLLSQYKERTVEQYVDRPPPMTPQNLFCTILNIARKFSDCGWYKESNLLLTELLAASEAKGDWTTANFFITLEQIVNAEREKKNAPALWTKVDGFLGFSHESEIGRESARKRITYDYTLSEKLRRFAIAFYHAGEFDRANIFLTQAIKTYSPSEQKPSPTEEQSSTKRIIHNRDDRGDSAEADHVYLLLDAACIKAKLKDFSQSQKYLTEAFSYKPLSERSYGAKLAELASVYCEQGKQDDAIKFLKVAQGKEIPTASGSSRHNTSGAFLVDLWLAKVLFDKGNIAESRKVIEKAIETSRKPASSERGTNVEQSLKKDFEYSSCVLAGDCASAEKDMAAAALRYEEAGMPLRFGTLPITDQLTLNKYWLQKAIACAEKDPKFPKDDLARMYVELAGDRRITPLEEKLQLYKKAVELMSDSNPQKSNLTSKLAQLVAQTKYALTNPSEEKLVPRTEAEQQMVKASIREKNLVEVGLYRKAAKIAEANGEPTAYSKYIVLANAEAGIDQLDQAIKDCMHGLSLYNGIRASTGSEYGYWRPTILNAYCVLNAKLSSSGRARECIRLLEFAVSRTRSANGSGSEETFDQLLELLQFYRGQKDNAQALAVLDRALQCTMQRTPMRDPFQSSHGSRPNPMERIWSWPRESAKDNPKLAIEILEKTLEAQRKQLPSDDMQIGLTLNALGDVYRMSGKDQSALENYQKAFDIIKLYNGELIALNRMSSNFIPTMRAVGNIQEADRLQSMRDGRDSESKNRFLRRRDLESKQLDFEALKDAYEKSKAAAPYSIDTVRLLDWLRNAAENKSDWTLYEKCTFEQIKIAERFKSPDLKRYKEGLFRIYLRSKNFPQAEEFLADYLKTFSGDDRERARLQQDLIDAYIGARQLDGASQYIRKLWQDPNVDGLKLAQSEVSLIDAYNRAEKQRKLDQRSKETDKTKIDEINKHLEDFSPKGKEEVHHLFVHRKQWIPKVQVFALATRIGRLAVDSRETEHLAELLTKGEPLMYGDQLFSLKELADLWSAIGEKTHAEELRAKLKAFARTKAAQGFRESSEADGFGASRVQTGAGNEFPPANKTSDYCFSFVALASHSLTLADNSRVCMDVPPFSFSFAGTYGELKTAQPANHSGSLSYVASMPIVGTHGGTLGPLPLPFAPAPPHGQVGPFPGPNPPASGGLGPPPFASGGFFPGEVLGPRPGPVLMRPPATQSVPFKAALRPNGVGAQFGGEGDEAKVGLGPGDWKVGSNLKLKGLTIIGRSGAGTQGRLRLFLPNKPDQANPVFHAEPGALINAHIPSAPAMRGALLELWYEGEGTIKLDRDCTFNGIIYAPNARVEIGPGDATFTGSIVAKDIVVTGNSRLYWDMSLADWKP